MSTLCSKEKCTGCGACYKACPASCISFNRDEAGFYYPSIDESKCLHCGLCGKICPVNHYPQITNRIFPKAYAAINTNQIHLKQSASGGMFRAFAENFEGSIYGAVYKDDWTVHIKKASSESDLDAMQGSKYVYSHAYDVFSQIKEELENSKKVLFFGLPCQVAGLRNYLRQDYEKLICVDIVCHGTPSEKLFQDYIRAEEESLGKIQSINFTDKTRKWVPLIERNTRIYSKKTSPLRDYTNDPYMTFFINGWSYHNSCFNCSFANIERVGDITLGDFFGLGIKDKYLQNTTLGVSQVIINTQKGETFYNSLTNISSTPRALRECMNGNRNLWRPTPQNNITEDFYNIFIFNGYDSIYHNYFLPFHNNIIVKIKRLLRHFVPNIIARLMLNSYHAHGDSDEIESILQKIRRGNNEKS